MNKQLITLITIFFFSNPLYAQNDAKKMAPFELPIYKSDQIFKLDEKLKKHSKILINFWAAWCTSCIEELPDLEKLKANSKGKDILFVAINAGESSKKIKKFLKKYKFSYLILEDKNRVVSKSLGVKDLPKTYVLDSKGNILFKKNRPPKKL
jgi:thiol-disulfide isomerase/thioredoxin